LKDCTQDPTLSKYVGTCYSAECDPNVSADAGVFVNEGCYLVQIVNTTVNSCGLCCGSELSDDDRKNCISGAGCSKVNSQSQSLAVGGLFLAAILIAIIACCILAGLLGGKKGYDIYLKNKGVMNNANTSPLYKDDGMTGVSPLYDANN